MSAILEWVAPFVLNVFVSVLSSWAVAAYYFRRETRAEKIADQIKSGLQKALIPLIYPQFFDESHSLTVHPVQPRPSNYDVPFVEFGRFNQRSYAAGEQVSILLKIVDTGLDLVNPDGISVRDHIDSPIAVTPVGLGYAKVAFYLKQDARPGHHELTVCLQDRGVHCNGVPNKTVQTLPFFINGETRHESAAVVKREPAKTY